MSREIKFRAWDKLRNEMQYPIGTLNTDIIYRFSDCQLTLGQLLYRSQDTISLQQYTGLHDKNGVEIYEGDIVRDLQGNGCVGYNPPSFSVDTGEEYHYYLGGGQEYPHNHCLSATEVIGNIYENGDLLK